MNRERAFVYIGASIVVAVVILIFLARPAYEDMVASKKNLDSARTEEANVSKDVADTKQLIANYGATPQDQIQGLNAHIPDFTNEADIIAELESVGKSTHSLLTSIRFNEGEKATFGTTIHPLIVSVVVTGEYKQLNDYVASLEQSKRIFNLGPTSFATTGNVLTASISFTAYFSKVDKPASTVATQPTTTTN